MEDDTYQPPDPDAVRDLWLSCARPLNKKGKMDTMRHQTATNARMRDVARTQNYWLHRSVFQVSSERYDLIDWSKK
ncbi:MAG TPA: hypothetical protein VNG51_16905 [Ktedonobacteraceae bacterium]|nr:hypothetical protein [Ktedonobacteraceae bacterium]